MKFTGRNLLLVHAALGHAIAEVHNQIATCPDVVQHADTLKALAAEHQEIEALITGVRRALKREGVEVPS